MFFLDAHLPQPLYTQLYRQIRSKILNNEMPGGSKLPSSRGLAGELKISRNTVETAFQQLLAEGYLVSQPRSGYFVASFNPDSVNALAAIPEEPSVPVQSGPKSVRYDFKYGRLNAAELPVAEWQRLTNQCLREFPERLADYGPFRGEEGLRREIQRYLRDYRDVRCTAEQIVVGPGTQFSLGLACRLLRERIPVIAMENPGFQWARLAFQNHGAQVVPVPLDRLGLDVRSLQSLSAKAVYVTPSHQFPTGIIMPVTRRLELIDWAKTRQSYIIEDDYSCHLRYNISPLPALQSLAPEHVIHIGSFSKFLFPSIRVSYMVLPNPLLRDPDEHFSNSASYVPFIIQNTLERFMREGYWESYLRRTTRLQKAKHDALIAALRREFGDKMAISGQNAGLHILIQALWQTTEEKLIRQAEDAGVLVYSASKYWFNPDTVPHATLILGYGGLGVQDIPTAVGLLRKAWLPQ